MKGIFDTCNGGDKGVYLLHRCLIFIYDGAGSVGDGVKSETVSVFTCSFLIAKSLKSGKLSR